MVSGWIFLFILKIRRWIYEGSNYRWKSRVRVTVSKVFHENGHIVYPLVRNEVALTQLKKMFSCRCFPILADLSADESTEQMKNQIEEYTEYIDLVINNAGITGKETEVLHTNSEELTDLFNIHCLGVIRAVKVHIWL